MHLKTFQRQELNIVQKTLEPTEATENVLLKLFSKVVERILLDRLSRQCIGPRLRQSQANRHSPAKGASQLIVRMVPRVILSKIAKKSVWSKFSMMGQKGKKVCRTCCC